MILPFLRCNLLFRRINKHHLGVKEDRREILEELLDHFPGCERNTLILNRSIKIILT